MTKEEEISILRDTIERLGPDGYLGQWLTSSLPGIASWIRNDMYPPTAEQIAATSQIDRDEARRQYKQASDELSEARHKARQLIDAAHKDARAIRQEAYDRYESTVEEVRQQARCAVLQAIG
jgi:uncharacterized membrane protein